MNENDELFVEKLKKPKLDSNLTQTGTYQYLDFNCGDLYLRKNVVLKKDNVYCYKTFSKFVDKLKTKLKRFRWQMSYHMPSTQKEIDKLINTQTTNKCLQTGPVWINTITYNFNLNNAIEWGTNDYTLYLTADLIWTDLKSIVKLTKKLIKLKKIVFVDYNIWFKPKALGDNVDIRHYIINKCGNKKFKWWCSAPRLKNTPHLKKLIKFRKSIDKKIKFEFYNNDYDIEIGDYYKDDCQKILKEAKII